MFPTENGTAAARYDGPERREPSLGQSVAMLAEVVHENGQKIDRLARLIEGENGTPPINRGVVGVLDDLQHTDAKLDKRVSDLEHQWNRFKWSLLGFAAGGGVLGGVTFDTIRHLVGT